MFDKLYKKLKKLGLSSNIKNVFKILDENPAISKINENLTSKYHGDQSFINKLKRVTKIKIN